MHKKLLQTFKKWRSRSNCTEKKEMCVEYWMIVNHCVQILHVRRAKNMHPVNYGGTYGQTEKIGSINMVRLLQLKVFWHFKGIEVNFVLFKNIFTRKFLIDSRGIKDNLKHSVGKNSYRLSVLRKGVFVQNLLKIWSGAVSVRLTADP